MFKATLPAVACLLFVGASTALADAKPTDAVKANPQDIANFWAGKTHTWRDCKGGIYYGGGWKAEAWCEKNNPAVGIGTWSVDANGTICHDLTWYWKEGNGVGSDSPGVTERSCEDHVQTSNGEIWNRWRGHDSAKTEDWWRPANSDGVNQGYDRTIKRKISRLRKKLDI